MTHEEAVIKQREIITDWHKNGKPSAFSEPPYLGFMPKFPKALKRIRQLDPQPGRILDIGGFTGYWARELVKRGYSCAVIDIQKDLMKRMSTFCTPESKIEYKFAAAENIPYPDNTFDVITAFDVLEHCLDFKKALSEIHRVCAPGGTMYVTLPRDDMWQDSSGEHTEVFSLSRVKEIWTPLGAAIEPVDDENGHLATFITWKKKTREADTTEVAPGTPVS